MIKHGSLFLAASLIAMGLVACSQSENPANPESTLLSDNAVENEYVVQNPNLVLPKQAFMDLSLSVKDYTGQQMAQVAACPMAIFQVRVILSDEAAPVINAIRAARPDIKIFGVNQVLTLPLAWDEVEQRQRFPMSGELYDLLESGRTLTTTGDVAWTWPGNQLLNPIDGQGNLKLATLQAELDIVQSYMLQYPGAMDGVFHDHLSLGPWLFNGVEGAPVTGEVDFDGDQNPFPTDGQELAAWYGWEVAMLQEWQSRFGANFIQVANGRLPQTDPFAASLLAGIVYENFPVMPWYFTEEEGIEGIINNSLPGYMTPRQGQTWSIAWDTRGKATDICRLTSMLTGHFYSITIRDGFQGRDQYDLLPEDPGMPLGDLVRRPLAEGGNRYTRRFGRGTVVMETNANRNIVRAEFIPAVDDEPRVYPGDLR